MKLWIEVSISVSLRCKESKDISETLLWVGDVILRKRVGQVECLLTVGAANDPGFGISKHSSRRYIVKYTTASDIVLSVTLWQKVKLTFTIFYKPQSFFFYKNWISTNFYTPWSEVYVKCSIKKLVNTTLCSNQCATEIRYFANLVEEDEQDSMHASAM